MKMCIAEKPSVAKEIAMILGANTRRDGYMEGNGYCVTWTFGHLCTLYEPGEYTDKWKYWRMDVLPMIPSNFLIKVINDSGIIKQFNTIKKLVSKAEMVINCGDAGQEGELIQRWVLYKAKCKVPIKRLWISSLTEEAIREGFSHLYDSKDFDTLYSAGSVRAIGDWLLGMNATRAYTLKFGSKGSVLSIGRVQTPTLALIVNRQKEIENFTPELYWEIKTNYRDAYFSYINGKFGKKEDAEKVLSEILDKELEITHVSRKNAKEYAPKLFDLTLLQVECNRKFSFSADKTLQIIQSLYEKKLTTYPRVDTNFLPNDVYSKVPKILSGLEPYETLTKPLLNGKKIKKSSRVFNDKKITDHHAIIPTGIFTYDMQSDEKKVYDLVSRRFIAAFYPECEIANTLAKAKVEKYIFKATGKEILKAGWRVVLNVNSNEDNVLPLFVEGEKGPHKPELAEKMTKAPKYYTEADLLRAMETAGKQVDDEELQDALKENGIGRPSTRANIIETLLKRHYIDKDKKRLVATTTGIGLIDTIQNELLKSPELTGQWEKKMREIEDGKYDVKNFMFELKNMVNEVVHNVKYSRANKIDVVDNLLNGKASSKSNDSKNSKDSDDSKNSKLKKSKSDINNIEKKEKVELICPKCGKGKIMKGKHAWGCNLYGKSCDFLIPMEVAGKTLTLNQINSLVLLGKSTLIKGFKEGNGDAYDGYLFFDKDYSILIEKKI